MEGRRAPVRAIIMITDWMKSKDTDYLLNTKGKAWNTDERRCWTPGPACTTQETS